MSRALLVAGLLLATAGVWREAGGVGRKDRLTAHATRLPEQTVQIKLGDLLELVPRKSSPEQKEIVARLTAIEARLAAIEAKLGVVPGALGRGRR